MLVYFLCLMPPTGRAFTNNYEATRPKNFLYGVYRLLFTSAEEKRIPFGKDNSRVDSLPCITPAHSLCIKPNKAMHDTRSTFSTVEQAHCDGTQHGPTRSSVASLHQTHRPILAHDTRHTCQIATRVSSSKVTEITILQRSAP